MRTVIDGNSLLYRAFYGVRQRLTRPDGIPVNAVFGFCNMLLPLLAAAKFDDEFICVFDAERKNWRHEIYPAYKGNRDETPQDLVAQIDLARDATRAMGIPCLVVPGVEADDVIATLVQDQCPTRILSSDKDLMQLVSPCCYIYDTMKGEQINENNVMEKYGVRPDQMIDCQALIGDSSDNVPGVHGIGPKKASDLLNEFGTLENIYDNLSQVKNERVRNMLIEGRDSAFMSKKLVTLKTDVVVPKFGSYKFDPTAAIQFFTTQLGSQSLAEKVRKTWGSAINVDTGNEEEVSSDIYIYDAENPNWEKLRNPDIKKIAYDWKSIFHKLDSAGHDVSEITPIDDVMLMNYATNFSGSGNVFDDYKHFISGPSKIYDMDLAILRPLFYMEKNGVLIDVQKLKEISDRLHKQANELQTKIWELAGGEFNIGSPKQLAEILFDRMGLPTDKHRSTDADKLSELGPENKIAELVLDWRTLTKLTGTYTDAFPQLIGTDGRIHTTYLQTSTNTGRLSSRNPNLQNIPIKSEIGGEIRKCFIAPRGSVLISCDYSQMELRILADIADVALLKNAFLHGKDIHSETAERIFGMVTPENRRISKTINFSIIYGVSPYGLASQLGISQHEAAKIIEDYMSELPEVKKYIDDTKQFATDHGYVTTPLGRKIVFPDVNNAALRAYSLRAAVNAPIQGFEADIMRLAMAKLANLPIKMILQVHDEFVFECEESSAEKYAKEIKEIMESIVPLSVPLQADYKISECWEK